MDVLIKSELKRGIICILVNAFGSLYFLFMDCLFSNCDRESKSG